MATEKCLDLKSIIDKYEKLFRLKEEYEVLWKHNSEIIKDINNNKRIENKIKTELIGTKKSRKKFSNGSIPVLNFSGISENSSQLNVYDFDDSKINPDFANVLNNMYIKVILFYDKLMEYYSLKIPLLRDQN